MDSNSFVTSFVGLFQRDGGDATVQRIEIPLIQRDYAQGRDLASVRTIRENFLDVLHDAVNGGDPVGLDFVYGEVVDGTLEPLDGQQRLTTLFLLHWYIASRAGHETAFQPWADFSYATRSSARLFCSRLVRFALPNAVDPPSAQITDQPWYLHVWLHDPTIQSMLVMVDAIHDRFGQDDLEADWMRLTDPEHLAVSFHVLPIEDMGSTEDLYIKMNSRGKPLTDFENFKARLEKVLDGSERATEFGHKVDGAWADVMWPLRGSDDDVDDEFLSYFRFIIELCEWRRDDIASRRLPLIERARLCFESGEVGASEHLAFLFDSFDTWVDTDTVAFFDAVFYKSPTDSAAVDGRVALFGTDGNVNVNLFEAACRDLDVAQRFGSNRKLLTYAVLLHRIHGTEEFPRRLRVVRNLIEASENEIRLDRMPRMLIDVRRVVVDGDLEHVEAFNQAQLADEIRKAEFLVTNPHLEHQLHELEDHDLLRGALMAFELDEATFADRADAFRSIFGDPSLLPSVTGALLAAGPYQRRVGPNTFLFGSSRSLTPWRTLLTGTSRENLESTRLALAGLLDQVAASPLATADALEEVRVHWLASREDEGCLDWRYYVVRYQAMRDGTSGIYASASDHLGYSLCMLNKQQLNSYYRDPFLWAMVQEAQVALDVSGGVIGDSPGPWFTGYATTERWMALKASNTRIRCDHAGFELRSPESAEHVAAFDAVCVQHGATTDEQGITRIAVPTAVVDARVGDALDRIRIGADLLQSLIGSGL